MVGGLLDGERLGSYRIVRRLGEGGMGVVYEALNEDIDRRVAIKVLHPEFCRDSQQARRFLNEARAANLIRHPGIVSISEFGQTPDGMAYLVMELLDGESLRTRLLRRQPVLTALRIGRQLASVLRAAHEQHIVHRDLKPDNVMLVPDPDVLGGERVKLLDFGIAKLAEQSFRAAAPQTPTDFRTRAGTILGTPHYMAPEQCTGTPVAEPADVYSLGVMLYEMLSGTVPFQASSAEAIIAKHIYEVPPHLSNHVPELAPAVVSLVDRMLAKAPSFRPSMVEICAELATMIGLDPSRPDPLPAGPHGTQVVAGSIPPIVTRGQTGHDRRPSHLIFAVLALGVLGAAWHVRLVRGTGTAAPPPTARCSLRTVPSSAQVLSESGALLGATPWEGPEHRPGEAPMTVILRRAGYRDLSVPLDPTRSCGRTFHLSNSLPSEAVDPPSEEAVPAAPTKPAQPIAAPPVAAPVPPAGVLKPPRRTPQRRPAPALVPSAPPSAPPPPAEEVQKESKPYVPRPVE